MHEFIVRETDLSNLSKKGRQHAEELIKLLSKTLSGENQKCIHKPSDVYDMSLDLLYEKKEHFIMFVLNSKNKVLMRKTVSIGSLNASIVHPREVFSEAIVQGAASIICVHNHPSGDPTPSPEDLEVTRRLVAAGEIIGIQVLDHIVVGQHGFYSMKEMGEL